MMIELSAGIGLILWKPMFSTRIRSVIFRQHITSIETARYQRASINGKRTVSFSEQNVRKENERKEKRIVINLINLEALAIHQSLIEILIGLMVGLFFSFDSNWYSLEEERKQKEKNTKYFVPRNKEYCHGMMKIIRYCYHRSFSSVFCLIIVFFSFLFQWSKERQLNYYQWTPFIILLMAIFFYFPRLIWRALSVRSGIDLMDIISAAGDTKKMNDNTAERNRVIKYIVDTIDMYVDDARRQANAEKRQIGILRKFFQLLCCMTGKFLGNYFITLYMFLK